MAIDDRHLTEEELLRYADGEIPEAQSGISRHLLSCWDCRARLSDLEAAIKAIVQFRNKDFLPAIPNPPTPWKNIEDQLRFRAAQAKHQPLWSRIFSLTLGSLLHHRAVSAVSVAIIVVLSAIWLLRPPTVSASAELAKATTAESAANLTASSKIIHQRFRVRKHKRGEREGASVDFGVWRGPALYRLTAPSTSASVLKELETLYRANGLDWNDPLSATAYCKWRTRAVHFRDAVTFQHDQDRVTVRTSMDGPSSSIHVAEITFRTNDYHTVDERFQTSDSDYEITETHWDLVSPEAFSAAPRVKGTSRGNAVPAATGAPSEPSRSGDADETEMEIRHSLHHLNADLGDPITVGRGPQGEIVVEVLSVTPERMMQVEELLHRFPSVVLDRTGTLLGNSQACVDCLPPSPLLVSSGAVDDLDASLLKHFGGSDELRAFAHEILNLSGRAMSHAYALRTLASRYDETIQEHLSRVSKEKLWEMISNHVGAIAETAVEIETKFRPVLHEVGLSRDEERTIPESSTWQSGTTEAFGKVQAVDRLLKTALAKTNSAVTSAEALRQLPAEMSRERAFLTRYRSFAEKESNLK